METALQDLEEMAAKLQEATRKLTPGPARRALLQEFGRFRVQISILRHTKSGAAAPAGAEAKPTERANGK